MFNNKKENKINITTINQMLEIGKKLMKIIYFVTIICLILLGTYLIEEWHILNFIRDILIVISPVFIGIVAAWLCEPIVDFLQSKNFSRLLSCIIIYAIIIGLIALILCNFIPLVMKELKDFAITLPEILNKLKLWIEKLLNIQNNLEIKRVLLKLYGGIEKFIYTSSDNLPNIIIDIGKNIIGGGALFFLGIIISFYILYDFNKIRQYALKLLPQKWHQNTKELYERINDSLRKYVQGVLLIMILVFLTQAIGLYLAGLKEPFIFALFCAITDIIPYFGPYIGAIPAIIVGFATSPAVGLFTIISIIIIQLLENNLYQPIIMGQKTKLHPIVIILSLLIFEHFFGIIGMIVATPIVSCCKTIYLFMDEKMNEKNSLIE